MSTDDNLKEQIKEQIRKTQPPPKKEGAEGPRAPGRFTGRASPIEVAGFFREFGILTNAEYPVPRALRLLGRVTSNPDLAQTVRTLADQVEKGTHLSKAMGMFPWYFDPVVLNITKAAEASGDLDHGLTYIADMLEFDQDIRDRIWNALMYPLVLISLSVGVILALLLFVVPMFAENLSKAGGKFEGISAFVFGVSEFLRSPWIVLLLAAIVGGGVAAARWRANNPTSFDMMLGRIPVIGRLMKIAALTRFVNMFHMLTINGIGILQCLDLAKGAMNNAYLRRAIADMHKSVEAGRSLAEPLRKYTDLPPVVVDMVSVGEDAGKLPQMLESLSKTMRAQLLRSATRIAAILQPLLMVIIGFIILIVVLSFFFPYFDVLTSLAQMR